MLQGWNLKDEIEWEKFRLTAWASINSHPYLKKPISMRELLHLPSIDGDYVNDVEQLREKILNKRKEMALYLNG